MLIKQITKQILFGLSILTVSIVLLVINLTSSAKHELKLGNSIFWLLIAIVTSVILILRSIQLRRSSSILG